MAARGTSNDVSNLLTAIDPSNNSGVCVLPHPSQSLGELFVRPAPLEALLQPAVIPEIKMSRAASEACMRLRFAASGPFTSRADATPVLELRFKA